MSNLIKFRDMTFEETDPEISEACKNSKITNPANFWSISQYKTFYDTYLRGKWAYFIHMRYIVPIITDETWSESAVNDFYIRAEQDVSIVIGNDFRDNNELPKNGDRLEILKPWYPELFLDNIGEVGKIIFERYTDFSALETSSDILEYIRENEIYETYGSGDIEENAKDFRNWLASNILLIDQDSDGNYKNEILTALQTRMLEYFSGGLTDSCLESVLEVLENSDSGVSSGGTSCNCGCTSGNTLESLYGTISTGVSDCDIESLYKSGMTNIMKDLFGDTGFWQSLPETFLENVRNVIRYIIDSEWSMTVDDNTAWTNPYEDCACNCGDASDDASCALERFWTALGYILSGSDETCSHKNYIYTALSGFSEIFSYMIF